MRKAVKYCEGMEAKKGAANNDKETFGQSTDVRETMKHQLVCCLVQWMSVPSSKRDNARAREVWGMRERIGTCRDEVRMSGVTSPGQGIRAYVVQPFHY